MTKKMNKQEKGMILAKSLMMFLVMLSLSLSATKVYASEQISGDDVKEKSTEESKVDLSILEKGLFDYPIFISSEICEIDKAFMTGKSYKENDNIGFDDLRMLHVTYYGFDDKAHIGKMVVHKVVADQVLDVFADLFEARFPIERVELVDHYEANDDLSMAANNSSAFNYRFIGGTTKLSNHAYGLAIDINPIQNPFVTSSGNVYPPEGQPYVDRTEVQKGMIIKDDVCYNAFISRGFTWGGNWTRSKDYQHFEIEVEWIND